MTPTFCYRLFDWRPERALGEPQKHERVVIIKNLFSPEDFDKEVALLLEYQQDIRSECLKCGDVRKVVIYDVSIVYYSYRCSYILIYVIETRFVSIILVMLLESLLNKTNSYMELKINVCISFKLFISIYSRIHWFLTH